MFTAFLK